MIFEVEMPRPTGKQQLERPLDKYPNPLGRAILRTHFSLQSERNSASWWRATSTNMGVDVLFGEDVDATIAKHEVQVAVLEEELEALLAVDQDGDIELHEFAFRCWQEDPEWWQEDPE